MSRSVVWIVATAMLAGCGGGRPQGSAVHHGGPRLSAALARTLDTDLRTEVQQSGIPGASAAIVFPDGREWSYATGLAALKPRVAMTTDTSFPFDSVTKMATAALALRLVQEGRLHLDDPVVHWYPAWRGDRAATVSDLLGHTSGAADISDAAFERLVARRGRRVDVTDVIEASPRPGPRTSDAAYSGTGIAIAGLILARAAGEPLAPAMRRRVLHAPGGDGLAFQPGELPHPPLVHPYAYPHGLGDPVDTTDGSGRLPDRQFTQVIGAGAGLAGDVPSLARWGRALLGGSEILAPDSLRAMTTFHASDLWEAYGLGLARDSIDERPMWGHTGDGDGSHTELWHLPRDRVTIAISWNDGALDREAPFLNTLLHAALASH